MKKYMSYVLILGFLKDDKDGEMDRMVNVIENKYLNRKCHTTVLKYRNKINGINILKVNKIIIAGHSYFYSGCTKISVSLKNRTIGGFDINLVVELLYNIMSKCCVDKVIFYVCESAMNFQNSKIKKRMRKIYGKSRKKNSMIDMHIGKKYLSKIEKRLDKLKYGKVSTVEYFILMLSHNRIKKYGNGMRRLVKFIGINGMGYVDKDSIRSFDGENLCYFKKLDETEFEQKYVHKKKSVDLIRYLIHF